MFCLQVNDGTPILHFVSLKTEHCGEGDRSLLMPSCRTLEQASWQIDACFLSMQRVCLQVCRQIVETMRLPTRLCDRVCVHEGMYVRHALNSCDLIIGEQYVEMCLLCGEFAIVQSATRVVGVDGADGRKRDKPADGPTGALGMLLGLEEKPRKWRTKQSESGASALGQLLSADDGGEHDALQAVADAFHDAVDAAADAYLPDGMEEDSGSDFHPLVLYSSCSVVHCFLSGSLFRRWWL